MQHQSFSPVNRLVQILDSLGKIRTEEHLHLQNVRYDRGGKHIEGAAYLRNPSAIAATSNAVPFGAVTAFLMSHVGDAPCQQHEGSQVGDSGYRGMGGGIEMPYPNCAAKILDAGMRLAEIRGLFLIMNKSKSQHADDWLSR